MTYVRKAHQFSEWWRTARKSALFHADISQSADNSTRHTSPSPSIIYARPPADYSSNPLSRTRGQPSKAGKLVQGPTLDTVLLSLLPQFDAVLPVAYDTVLLPVWEIPSCIAKLDRTPTSADIRFFIVHATHTNNFRCRPGHRLLHCADMSCCLHARLVTARQHVVYSLMPAYSEHTSDADVHKTANFSPHVSGGSERRQGAFTPVWHCPYFWRAPFELPCPDQIDLITVLWDEYAQ